MRILGVCDYITTPTSGGAERVAREVYKRLAMIDGVDLVAVGAEPFKRARPSAEIFNINNGFPTFAFKGIDLSEMVGIQLMTAPGMARFIRQIAKDFRPDLIHAHGLYFHGSIAAASVARSLDIPFVITAHIGAPTYLPLSTKLGVQLWDATIGRRIVNSAKIVVAVSESVAQRMASVGVPKDRIIVAPNGVDHSEYSPDPSFSTTDELRVAFVGRLIANKGPEIALEALSRVHKTGRRVAMSFFGDGPLLKKLTDQAFKLGLSDIVTFFGPVDDLQLRLRSIDVLVRPSLTEGLPLALLEAMAAGVVVACSAVPGNLDVIIDGENGLVFPAKDAGGLAGALIRLIDNPELTSKLRSRAISDSQGWNWENAASGHLDAFRLALKDG